MKFIAISGPIASGKSTLAKDFVKIFGVNDRQAVIIPFASGLKYLASLEANPHAYGLAYAYMRSLGYFEHTCHKLAVELLNAFTMYPTVAGEKNRKLLQYVGTELGRELIHSDIWIRAVQKQIEDAEVLGLRYDYVIADDLRFVNESYFADFHVMIDTTRSTRNVEIYARHIAQFPKSYINNNHQSEQERSLLRVPDYILDIEPSSSQMWYVVQQILECF